MKFTFRRALGVLLIVLGVIALVTPLTPGSWLIFVGAEILGFELVFARKVASFFLQQREWMIGVLTLAGPLLVGALGGYATAGAIPTWYAELVKPFWNPPNFVFGPVWTTLYVLMGVAAFLVWRKGLPKRIFAMKVFFVHLLVNLLWSVVFFFLHAPLYAFGVIVVLWGMILWLMILFMPQSRLAAWMLAPYLLWVSYASTLNLGIILLN